MAGISSKPLGDTDTVGTDHTEEQKSNILRNLHTMSDCLSLSVECKLHQIRRLVLSLMYPEHLGGTWHTTDTRLFAVWMIQWALLNIYVTMKSYLVWSKLFSGFPLLLEQSSKNSTWHGRHKKVTVWCPFKKRLGTQLLGVCLADSLHAASSFRVSAKLRFWAKVKLFGQYLSNVVV